MRHRLILCLFIILGLSLGTVQAQDSASARLRVIHAADAPAVDVYIDGTLAATDVQFGDATPHFMIAAGTHQVEAHPAGSDEALLTQDVDVLADLAFSLVVQGDGSEGVVYEDILDSLAPGLSRLAAVHAISDADPVDIVRTDGAPLMVNLTYGQPYGTINIPTGVYDLIAIPAGGSPTEVIGEIGEVDLATNVLYTLLVAPGDDGAATFVYATPVNPDSGDHLVRFAHAAADGDAVDVYVDEMLVVPNLAAGDVTAHIGLPAGEHDLTLREAGSDADSDAVFSDSFTADSDAQTLAITADDDELTLLKLVDDVEGISPDMARIQILNVSADAVSMALEDGETLADALNPGAASDAVEVVPGEYSVDDWAQSVYGGTLYTLVVYGDAEVTAAQTVFDVTLDSAPTGQAAEVAAAPAETTTSDNAPTSTIKVLIRDVPDRAGMTLANLNIDAIQAVVGRSEAGDWLNVNYISPIGAGNGWVLAANLEGSALLESVDVAALPVGVGPQTIAPAVESATSPQPGILSSIDAPASGAAVNLPFDVAGWVVDTTAAPNLGIGVDLVRLYEGTTCGGSILGETVPVLARQDVVDGNGLDPRFVNSGFVMSVPAAPGGPITITACAHLISSDTFAPIDTRSITVQGGAAVPQQQPPAQQAPPPTPVPEQPVQQATPAPQQPVQQQPPAAQPNARPTKPGVYPPIEIIFGVVALNQGVNLQCREYPSTDARSLGLIPNGTEVEVVGLPAPRDTTGDIGRTDAITIETLPDFTPLLAEDFNVTSFDPTFLAGIDVKTLWFNVNWFLPDNTPFGCWVAAQYVEVNYRDKRIDDLTEYLDLVKAKNFELVPYNLPGGPRDPDVVVSPEQLSAPTPLPGDRMIATVNVNQGVNLQLRRTPGVSGESLALVPGGSQLYVVAQTEIAVTGNIGEPTVPEWLMVDFVQPNGLTVRGYISAEFVSLTLGGRLASLEDVPVATETPPGGIVNADGSIQ